MPISVILFVVIVIIFAVRGLIQGGWRALVNVLAWCAAYAAALVWGGAGAQWLQSVSPLQGFLALLLSASMIFMAVLISVKVLAGLLGLAILYVHGDEHGLSLLSRVMGGAISTGLGGVFALTAVYFYSFAVPMLSQTTHSNSSGLSSGLLSDLSSRSVWAESSPSWATQWANKAAALVTLQALNIAEVDSSLAKTSAAAMAEPVVTANNLREVSNSSELKSLFQNTDNQQLLVTGDVSQVMALPEFQALANSDAMQQLAGIAGIDTDASREQYQQQLAGQMSHAAQKMEAMRNDPRLQEILINSELQEQLKSGNPLQLLNNPDLKELTQIFLGDQ